jgi:hypothetical protein
MIDSIHPKKLSRTRRIASALVVCFALAVSSGCGALKERFVKNKVTVPPVIGPLVEAEMSGLVAEINRIAQVRSLQGRIDVQFLDTSFAECGVAEKYRTADGTLILQRPGQIYLSIKAPFGVKVADMSSDGQNFWVAVFQGDERYKKFARGTNTATYTRVDAGDGVTLGTARDGVSPCDKDGNRQANMQRAAVSSLSGLRPQHFTDALMLRSAATEGSNLLYSISESFEEEADTRRGAKRGARVVRGYYLLAELAPENSNRVRLLRRFWFDRVGQLSLARVQNYDDAGKLVTDVVYRNPKNFGEQGQYRLPSEIELTRPQDHYSLRITFQAPEEARVDEQYEGDIFVLKNNSNLPEVNLDERNRQ